MTGSAFGRISGLGTSRLAHRRNNKKIVIAAAAAAAVSLFMPARDARAATQIFDVDGNNPGFGITTGSTYDWDAVTNGGFWTADATGASATGPWVQGNFARFAPTGTPTYTITVSNSEQFAGMQPNTAQNLTFTGVGSGSLVSATGSQGFFGVAGTNVNFNVPITGTNTNIQLTNGVWTFSNTANNWTGTSLAMQASGASVKLGASNVIPDGLLISIITTATAPRFNMNGFDETIQGLSTGSQVAGVNLSGNLTLQTLSTTVASWWSQGGFGIQGTGTIIMTGTGIQKMVANSDQQTGPLKLMGGIWQVDSLNNSGNASGIGAASADPANLVIDGGTLGWIGKTGLTTVGTVGSSTDRGFTVGPNGGTIATTVSGNTELNPVTFTGAMAASATSGSQNLILDGAGLMNNVMGSAIQNGGGTNVTNLVKNGAGLWIITGANTYTGTTTVNAGTLQAGAAATLPSGSTLSVNGGTLDMTGFNQSVAGVSLVSGSIVGAGSTLTSATDYDIRSGTISPNLAGSVGLNKTTAGTATISGANTYTGNTTISLGKLFVNNTSGSGTSGGSVTVNATDANNFGTLGGTGTITGPVTVNANAHLAPGINGGNASLTLHTANLKADSNLDFALGAPGANPSLFGTNDQLIVLDPNGLTLDTTGSGTENIHLIGGGVGKYHLIQYDTALGGGSTSNLQVVTGAGTGIDSAVLSTSAGAGTTFFIDVTVTPTARFWNSTGGGNWSDGTKWGSDPSEPNGLGAIVTFGGAITADSTVTIDNASKTVGNLTLDNPSFKYTIAAASTNVLILDGVGTIPLTVANGNHTISAPIQLNKSVNVTVTNPSDSLTLGGAISGAGSAFTASGAGTLNVTGAMTNTGAFTSNNTGNVSVGAIADAAGITNASTGNLTLAGIVSGGGNITNNGSGTLTIAGTANTWNGKIFLNAGTLAVAANGSLGGASGTDMITMASGTTLRFLAGANLVGGRNITIPKDGNVFLDVPSGTATWAGYTTNNPNELGSQTTITKTGAGLLNWTSGVPANPNYDALLITGGVLQIANTNPLPTGAVTVEGGALQLNAGSISISGHPLLVGPGGGGLLVTSGGAPTWAGAIADSLDGTGTLTVPGAGTLVLTSFNSNSGGVNLNGTGTVTVGSDQAFGTGTLTLIAGTINSNAAHNVSIPVNLAGNVTVGGSNDVNFDTGNWTIVGGNRTVTVTNSANTNIFSNIGEDAPGRGFGKAGSGTLTLFGTNTYTGNTTVAAGTLNVSSADNLGASTNTLAFTGGTLNATAAMNTPNRNVTVNGGGGTLNDNNNAMTFGNVDGTSAFTKNGAGLLTVNHLRSGNLTVNGGSVAIVSSGGAASGTSRVGTLTLDPSVRFDISDNKLITNSPVGTFNGLTYSDVTGLIASGRNGGGWGGNGIVTSQSDATGGNFTSIGVASALQVKGLASGSDTAVWGGQTVSGSQTLAMYTYGGDANLDGKINVDDYGRIDFNVNLGTTGWYNGDFNYDGKINVDDYGIIDFNVGIQGAPFPTGSSAEAGTLSGVAAVPEPASMLSLAAACGVAGLRRRRRRLPD